MRFGYDLVPLTSQEWPLVLSLACARLSMIARLIGARNQE